MTKPSVDSQLCWREEEYLTFVRSLLIGAWPDAGGKVHFKSEFRILPDEHGVVFDPEAHLIAPPDGSRRQPTIPKTLDLHLKTFQRLTPRRADIEDGVQPFFRVNDYFVRVTYPYLSVI